MTDPAPLLPALPDIFDGFRLEIDPARERADVILDRAPLNVITMAEREQLRAVFEALDADARVRVIVLRAGGSIFRAAARSAAFSMPRPSMSRASPGTSPRRRAAVSRSLLPAAAIASASASNWRWPAISAWSRKPAFIPFPSSVSARSRVRAAPRACRRWSASRGPRTL